MKKKWNISILVIFVLLASSLLGILSMNFVQQMMKQSATVTSYYKAYYLSKAWIELWLSTIQHRGIWFEYAVNTGSAIILENFLTGTSYSISTTVSGTASMLSKKFWQEHTGCDYPYTLSGGESFVLPLFKDITPWPITNLFATWIHYQNLANIFKNNQIQFISEFDWEITFGMIILSGDQLSENGMFFKKWTLRWLSTFKDEFETYLGTLDSAEYPLESQLKNNYEKSWLIDNGFKMFLLVSNSSSSPQSFCVRIASSEPLLPWHIDSLSADTFFLQSQASYGNQIVALDASYAQPIPWFLFTTYSAE